MQDQNPIQPPAEPQQQSAPPEPSVTPTSVAQTSNTAQAPIDPTAVENTDPTPVKPPKRKSEGGIFSFILTIVVAVVLVQIVNAFLFQSYKVYGSSMYSTLHDGDRLIISKVGRTGAKITGKTFAPSRGQIIVFIDPQNPNIQLIKRVIGLPGERVVVRNGAITVYNTAHPDGFNPDDAEYGKRLPVTSGDVDIKVPKDHLFVSGDNRLGSNSLDSRNELGTVPEKNIVGTLTVRIFPFNSARFFSPGN